MSRLDDLPPDQRATLSLLLRSGKSYGEVASLLGIPERAVHDRAHAALAVLAPAQARALSAEQRAEVGDYVLRQRVGGGERLATRTYLEGSASARAWASALATELEPIAGGGLPAIPAAPPGPDAAAGRGDEPSAAVEHALDPSEPSPRAAGAPSPRSSRRAGALMLAAIVVVVAVVVAVVLSSGGGSSSNSSTSTSGTTPSGANTGTSRTTGTATAPAKEDRRVTLTSPDPTSKAVAVTEVLSEGSQYAFYLAAEHLPPASGFFYAVWLYNSPTSFQALGRLPSVNSSGNVQGGALLPKDAGKYHTMIVTRETKSSPSHPGPVVLHGAFGLH